MTIQSEMNNPEMLAGIREHIGNICEQTSEKEAWRAYEFQHGWISALSSVGLIDLNTFEQLRNEAWLGLEEALDVIGEKG